MSSINKVPAFFSTANLNEAAADAHSVRNQASLLTKNSKRYARDLAEPGKRLKSGDSHGLERTHSMQAYLWRHFNADRLRSLYRSMQDTSDQTLDNQIQLLFQKFGQLQPSDQGSAESFESLMLSIEEDPSKQYVIAVLALEELYKDPDASRPNSHKNFYLKQLKALALSLYENKGASVKAGLNSAKAIESALEGSGLEVTKSNIRSLYRKSLFDQTKPSGLVEKLLEKYKPEEFRVVVKALIGAVSDDLSSAACSDTLLVASALQSIKIASQIMNVFRAFEKGV